MFNCGNIHINTYTSSCLLARKDDRHTHPYPPLISRAQTHIPLGARLFLALSGALPSYTQTISYQLGIWLLMTHSQTRTHTVILMPTLDRFCKRTFLFHTYRRASLKLMQRYLQLAYLLLQCETNLLSIDGHITDFTVRPPGVELPFPSCRLWCVISGHGAPFF